MNTQHSEFDQALLLLKESTRAGRPPNRYHARALLLPLGVLLTESDVAQDQDKEEVRKLREATRTIGEAWRVAVADEIEMAITELVHASDPRYLSRPDYDLRYTLEARERMAQRLRAVKALGLVPDPALMRQLAQVDQRLQPHRGNRT